MANKRIQDLATIKYNGFMALDDSEGTGKFPIENLFNSMAPVFDDTVDYEAGQQVMYRGVLYVFTVPHTGVWNNSHVNAVNTCNMVRRCPTASASDMTATNFFDLVTANGSKRVKGADVASSDDMAIGFDNTITSVTDGANFTNCLVRSGHTYRIRVTCGSIVGADDPRIGIYLFNEYSTAIQIVHFSPAELMAGVDFVYTAADDGDIRVRTLEVGTTIGIKVTRVLKNAELLTIAHVGGGLYQKTVTTATDGPVEADIKLKKNVHYVCSLKADSNWASTSTDGRIGAYLWYPETQTYQQVLSTTAPNMKRGISFDFTPTDDCTLRPRALEGGVQIAVRLISDEESVEAKIAELEQKIASSVNEWSGKTWAAYGDSITAISNGDALNLGWSQYVNEQMGFGGFHGRGIGGTSFKYQTGGGTVAFITSTTGNYDSRDPDGHTKDNYTGAVPAGCTATRSAFCSWDRITHMFPADIKDSIDLIFVMGGTNDVIDSTDAAFVLSDATDPEWASSAYYSTYGGDFNIGTLKGGVASTIMKLNAWMPQALIVIGTPLSGRGSVGQISTDVNIEEYSKSEIIKEMAKRCSCPCVDVFATDGIMPFNRTSYITDMVHPYNSAGQKMLARAVIAGLKNVMPLI